MVSIRLLLLLTMALLSSCKKLFPDYKTRTSYFQNPVGTGAPDSLLTCVTYNVQLGFRDGQDPWDASQQGGSAAQLDSIAQVLRRVQPDIICLQEVPRNRSNSATLNFTEQLAARLHMNYAFGAHGHNEARGVQPPKGEWGNAILTRFTIRSLENHENEYVSKWRRRSILAAEVLVGSRPVWVYSLHFDPLPTAAATAATYFRERRSEAQLILGDFNLDSVPELLPAEYTDVLHTTSPPLRSIDRIYFSAGRFQTREVGVAPRSVGTSDHPAVYCRLAWP
ncbi:endonuclease/exonuclease/phosphatase family protein [Hymenobacter rigui]|uniref:Endonuclease/exonuclease/phosphatase family protein n=1 Tax=Hymenobacter rigui TaxID=334424 RepID=A0A428KQI0_9BACT|nr:endonuclease/exonuclease/phosphatase family protein [Hymenobacter rigui]RSK48810.1 endonuclease/exonuclease/phosphatase family protein [Hymenobacter rigui]